MDARDAIPRSRFRPYLGGANEGEMAAVIYNSEETDIDNNALSL
jgi:hypothetical protein